MINTGTRLCGRCHYLLPQNRAFVSLCCSTKHNVCVQHYSAPLILLWAKTGTWASLIDLIKMPQTFSSYGDHWNLTTAGLGAFLRAEGVLHPRMKCSSRRAGGSVPQSLTPLREFSVEGAQEVGAAPSARAQVRAWSWWHGGDTGPQVPASAVAPGWTSAAEDQRTQQAKQGLESYLHTWFTTSLITRDNSQDFFCFFRNHCKFTSFRVFFCELITKFGKWYRNNIQKWYVFCLHLKVCISLNWCVPKQLNQGLKL